MATIETPVTKFLDGKGISFRLFQHPGPIESLEQAARERDQIPQQIIRTILFRCQKDQFIIVLMPGTRRVSWPALRSHIGSSRITMATEQEVLKITGFRLGAVAPIGLPSPLRILVDHSVLEQSEISIGSGQRGLAIFLKPDDLLTAIENFELGQFSI